jgi:hypothetical protein
MTPPKPAPGGQEPTAAVQMQNGSSARPPRLPAHLWLRAASAGLMGGLVGLVLDFFWPCKAHKGRQ